MTLISYWYDVRHGDFGTIATNGPTAIGQKSTEEVSRCLYRLHKSDTDWLLVPLIVRFSKHREPTLSNRHHKETQNEKSFPTSSCLPFYRWRRRHTHTENEAPPYPICLIDANARKRKGGGKWEARLYRRQGIIKRSIIDERRPSVLL